MFIAYALSGWLGTRYDRYALWGFEGRRKACSGWREFSVRIRPRFSMICVPTGCPKAFRAHKTHKIDWFLPPAHGCMCTATLAYNHSVLGALVIKGSTC